MIVLRRSYPTFMRAGRFLMFQHKPFD